jgi:hypothetical protein
MGAVKAVPSNDLVLSAGGPRLGPTSPLSPNGASAHAAAKMLTRKNGPEKRVSLN